MTKPWSKHKDIILDLYVRQGIKLERVREIMKNDYHFVASIRSYRQHFGAWGVSKYNCKRRRSDQENSASQPSSGASPYAQTSDEETAYEGIDGAMPAEYGSYRTSNSYGSPVAGGDLPETHASYQPAIQDLPGGFSSRMSANYSQLAYDQGDWRQTRDGMETSNSMDAWHLDASQVANTWPSPAHWSNHHGRQEQFVSDQQAHQHVAPLHRMGVASPELSQVPRGGYSNPNIQHRSVSYASYDGHQHDTYHH